MLMQRQPAAAAAAAAVAVLQALLQRQRLAAEAVEQEQKEEEFHLQQAQVRRVEFMSTWGSMPMLGINAHDAVPNSRWMAWLVAAAKAAASIMKHQNVQRCGCCTTVVSQT
jgi:hypothetical protein